MNKPSRHRVIGTLRPDLLEFAAVPHREPCDFHAWALIERTRLVRRFRCTACGIWQDTPIYWVNEIEWRKPKPVDPLPDQLTIYDLPFDRQVEVDVSVRDGHIVGIVDPVGGPLRPARPEEFRLHLET